MSAQHKPGSAPWISGINATALVTALVLAYCFTFPAMAGSTDPVDNSEGFPEMSAFMVTGEETEPVTVHFTNGTKTVVFIPMVHIAAYEE